MDIKPNPLSARDFVLWLDEIFEECAGDEVTQGMMNMIGKRLKRTKDLMNAMEENLANASGFTAPPPAKAPVRTGAFAAPYQCDEDCPFCY